MEKQKIVWVILAVTLLLAAVLAGGLYFLKPNAVKIAGTGKKAGAALTDAGFSSYEYMKGKTKLPGLETTGETKPQEMTIVVGEKPENASASGAVKIAPPARTLKKSVPIKPKPVQIKKRVTQPKRTVKTRKTVKPKPKSIKEYWIQAGSYKSNSKAEELKSQLTSKGITSRIITRDINGTTFFRVRIGPYVNKNEAEKFLSWIKKINGLEKSYISLVYTKK